MPFEEMLTAIAQALSANALAWFRFTAYGYLLLTLLAAAIAFSTGCSRIFLQVHYASDVMAGFTVGVVWLFACIISIELARFYRAKSVH